MNNFLAYVKNRWAERSTRMATVAFLGSMATAIDPEHAPLISLGVSAVASWVAATPD